MKITAPLRWALIPIVAIAGCSGVTLAADIAGPALYLAVSPAALEGALPLDVRDGLVCGAAALTFVMAGAMCAPRWRVVVATLLYAAGAYVAWLALSWWSFPKGHPRAYQPSQVPLVLTLLGGLVGVVITAVVVRRSTAAARETAALGH